MTRPIKILLQTTIPTTPNDWSIARFNLLAQFLRVQRDEGGKILFEVISRDRDGLGAPDRVLSALDQSDFDELWLFAVDTGEGLTAEGCGAITRFRDAGRGLMVTRDHMDLGSSICTLGGVGAAHHFHSRNIDPNACLNQMILIQRIFPGRTFTQVPTGTIRKSMSISRRTRF
jgi:hypothetical protein